MPILPTPQLYHSYPFSNGHVQTLFPPVFRKVPEAPYVRERIDTPDGDFLDVDMRYADSSRQSDYCVVLSHGLEGHSQRKYIRGMAGALQRAGFDVAAWNFRGCSGEPNRTLRLYHSGVTDDLHTVIQHCVDKGYSHIALVGFSMGGNQILKYLGEVPDGVAPEVCASVTFSVPCDLTGAAKVLDRKDNRIYMWYFLRTLRQKVRAKHEHFPQDVSLDGLDAMRTFREFDDTYTAPIHGFANAEEYWERCGCGQFLEHIRVPTLLVNAKNDPFLSPTCFPTGAAHRNPFLFLELPDTGGHVGFVPRTKRGVYWSEQRAVSFLQQIFGL